MLLICHQVLHKQNFKTSEMCDFSVVVNLAYVDTVDPVTHSTERSVTGDVIEKHHLRTNIGLLVDS